MSLLENTIATGMKNLNQFLTRIINNVSIQFQYGTKIISTAKYFKNSLQLNILENKTFYWKKKKTNDKQTKSLWLNSSIKTIHGSLSSFVKRNKLSLFWFKKSFLQVGWVLRRRRWFIISEQFILKKVSNKKVYLERPPPIPIFSK